MEILTTYVSFVLRLWLEEEADEPEEPDWRGEVEHIQTGRRWTFDTLEETLSFLRRHIEEPNVSRTSEG